MSRRSMNGTHSLLQLRTRSWVGNKHRLLSPNFPITSEFCGFALILSSFLSSSRRNKSVRMQDVHPSVHKHPWNVGFNFHKFTLDVNAPKDVFRGLVDRFNCISVYSQSEYCETDDFRQKLHKSMEYWEKSERRAIWFQVATEHSAWIPHLVQSKFDFHHAKPGIVSLSRWLCKREDSNIPIYSHTMLGVGGLVVNDKNEILVVTEKNALIKNSWKLPGGYVEPKEDIVDAAIREVREETGIDCTFKSVISIRHSHGGTFGCSDMYVVIALTPKNEKITIDEREILGVQWMPIDRFLKDPDVNQTNRQFLRTFLDYQGYGTKIVCEKAFHERLKVEYCVYSIQMDDKEDKISKV